MKPVGLIFEGGFALAQTPDELKCIIASTRGVFARSYNNDTEAYMSLVCEHVRRNTAARIVPSIPLLEDWRRLPFFMSPNISTSPVSVGRFFLLINLELAGVYDNIDLLVNDYLYDESLFIIELRHELEAVNTINDFYKNRVFRILPYITSKVPFITGAIPKNMLHRMPYIKLLEAVVTPEELKPLNPLNSVDIHALDGNHCPDEGREAKGTDLVQIAEIVN